MKNQKIKIYSIILTFFIMVSYAVTLTPLIKAQNTTPPQPLTTNYGIPNPSKYNSLEEIINAVTSIAKVVITLTFSGVIFYGGFLRLTSGGDEKKVEQSSKTLIAGIVGFAIIVFAQPITEFVSRLIGVQGGLFSK